MKTDERHSDQPNRISSRVATSRRWGAGAAAAALTLAAAVVSVHTLETAAADPAHVLTRPHWSDSGSGDNLAQTGTSSATAAQQVGVVDIETVLGRTGGRAAGTGMILTADGEVLTNNHVVAGQTSMTVTVVTTGRSYSARVVGADAADDVAVVRLEGASGLEPIRTATRRVSVGDAVVGVGNAGGQGGTPSAAAGRVTAIDRTITATNDDGSNPETLSGLIETDAAIAPGDSGGPLFNSSDQVVGMDTAAAASGDSEAYAIPIQSALAIARTLGSGSDTATAPRGTGAYLGVELQDGDGGAQVVQVLDGSPASAAGVAPGDTITSLDGQPVRSVADLSSLLAQLSPGRQVPVTWIDPDGVDQRSTALLGTRPTG